MSYEQVTIEVANHLKVEDYKKIRLTQQNHYDNLPRTSPIKYNGPDRLKTMLLESNRYIDTLYYEILNIQLPTLEKMKCLPIFFHDQKSELQSVHMLQLSQESTIADLIEQLKQELGDDYAYSDIRVMRIRHSRIDKVTCRINSHLMDRSAVRCWTTRHRSSRCMWITGPFEQKLYQRINST